MQHEHHHGHTNSTQNSKTHACCHSKRDMSKNKIALPEADVVVIYTCPMHPEIRQAHPGNCSICGMTLEPVTTITTEGISLEYIDMRRRFWLAFILTLPVFILEMGGHGKTHIISVSQSTWIQMVLATPVVLWGG